MPTITAYSYNAAIHCPDCTSAAAHANAFTRAFPLDGRSDEHGITRDMRDREGNAPAPVFSTDEHAAGYCDDCGMAYGDAPPVVPLLSVDAWREPGGGWTWNNWHRRGMVPAAWCDLSPRALFRMLRDMRGGIFPEPGACAVEDDGFNLVIVMRGTREPIGALAYGEAEK